MAKKKFNPLPIDNYDILRDLKKLLEIMKGMDVVDLVSYRDIIDNVKRVELEILEEDNRVYMKLRDELVEIFGSQINELVDTPSNLMQFMEILKKELSK